MNFAYCLAETNSLSGHEHGWKVDFIIKLCKCRKAKNTDINKELTKYLKLV